MLFVYEADTIAGTLGGGEFGASSRSPASLRMTKEAWAMTARQARLHSACIVVNKQRGGRPGYRNRIKDVSSPVASAGRKASREAQQG